MQPQSPSRCASCNRDLDPTLVLRTCPRCGAELWRPAAAPARPVRQARGLLALFAVVVLAGGAGLAIWLTLKDAIGSRGTAPPIFAVEGTRAAADALAAAGKVGAAAQRALADARAKLQAAFGDARALTGNTAAPLPPDGANPDERFQWDSQTPPVEAPGPNGEAAFVVGRLRIHTSGDAHVAVGVFDATTLRRVWRTESLGTWSGDEAYRYVHFALAGSLLLVVDSRGRAVIHDLATGVPRARVALTDRVQDVCALGTQAWLQVRDTKHVLIDVVAARTRLAGRPKACPRGGPAWHRDYCGRVRGAAVPSATCRNHKSAPKEEGVKIDRALFAEDLAVAIGQRAPGTPHGLLLGFSPDDKSVRWRRPIHEEDPDATAEGTPPLAELASGALYVAYPMRAGPHRLIAVDARTGKTRWQTAVGDTGSGRPDVLRAGKTRVYVACGSTRLEVYDAQDGRHLGTAGR